jgi:hypothetical protein
MNTKQEERYGLRPYHIDKTVRIGSYKDDYYQSLLPVYCKLEYKDAKLSISGVVAPLSNGDCRGSCGQMYDSIIDNLDTFKFAEGWDRVKAFQFVEYWKEWHLNDMQAGCEHQREEKTEKYCKICKYNYGSAWLKKEVPTKVLKWLDSLPVSDKIPVWI